MKKVIVLVAISLLTFAHLSCEKEDNEQKKKNQFEIGNDTHELSKGVLEYQGLHGDSIRYGYSMDLLSSAVSYQARENYSDDNWPNFEFTGTGNWISFEFESELKEDISGEYNDNWALFVTDYNFTDIVEHEVNWELKEDIWGYRPVQLNINKISSDTYEISFTYEGDNGNTLNGFYKGELNHFDHSY